jgi:hypothetical protein
LESIELVELDLEPVLGSSGVVHRRIGPGFSEIFGCFGMVLGDFMGEDWYLYEIRRLESIELIELYLESGWNHLE